MTNTQKAGDPLRKALLMILILALAACCAAAAAETEYQLVSCSGKMSLDENTYTVLTPDNLDSNSELLYHIGKSKEELLEDWKARGVQLQAWTKKKDACLEVSVFQDDESTRYYDLERQTRQVRREYLDEHRNASKKYIEMGYTIMKLDWKKQKLGGNFLKFEYKRVTDQKTWRGVMRKTVRNGWTVMLDYQVYDRLPRTSDESNLNRIANTVQFEVVEPAPVDASAAVSSDSGTAETVVSASASGLLQITVPPPAETNEDTFTVEGSTTPGAHLIGVAMRWSSSMPLKFTADAGRSGNFKLKVTLPDEGVWLLTLNLEINGVIVAEEIFETTTFSKTLLPVVLDSPVPEQIAGDELTISGVTSKAVSVQCIVTNGTTTFDKMIRTNGTGRFRFKVPSAAEGTYEVTLVFSKKNYNTRRLTYTASRNLSAQESAERAAVKAVHPSYAALTKKLDTYIGQTMVYKAYITDVKQNGEEWIITAALKKNKQGYSDLMVFNASSDPHLEADTQVKLYGTCVGAYQVQSEEGDRSYPSFDFLYSE